MIEFGFDLKLIRVKIGIELVDILLYSPLETFSRFKYPHSNYWHNGLNFLTPIIDIKKNLKKKKKKKKNLPELKGVTIFRHV